MKKSNNIPEQIKRVSESDIMAVFENFNNRLLRLEHIIGVQSDGNFVTDELDGEYDHDTDEYNKHTVTLRRACACLSQEWIDELIEYFKRGEDWIPSAFRKKA
jgi:hypothetical protein